MNLTTEIKTTITFKVEAFWNEEGGMGSDSFGGDYKTLEEAVFALHLAKAEDAKRCAAEKKKRLKNIYPVEWILTGYMTNPLVAAKKEPF